jgi:hypothetical protein
VAGWFQGEAENLLKTIWTIADSSNALDFTLTSIASLNSTMDFYVAGTKYDLTSVAYEDVMSGAPVHIAATWSQSTEELKFYINGTLRQTVSSVASGDTVDMDDIIVSGNTSNGLGFGTTSGDGYLQNFAVWNSRVLTGDEIAALASRGLGYHANWSPVTEIGALDSALVLEAYVLQDATSHFGATTTTAIVWDTCTVNRSGGLDLATGEWTAADDGVYLIASTVTIAGLSTTKHFDLHIHRNGSAWRTGDRPIGNVSATVETGSVFAIAPLDAGDVISIRCYNSDSSAVDLKGGIDLSRVCIWKLPVRGDNVHT